jgi:iron complex outermembrane recepter protein
MARLAIARAALAALTLSAATIVAQAQTAPEAGKPSPQLPQTAPEPGAAASSPGAVELPSIPIIQAQPERPKAMKKAVPHRAPPERAVSAEGTEQTVAMTPVKGSEIPLGKVPGAVSVVTSAAIARGGSPAVQDALQQNVPGALISSVSGSSFTADIQYRGFTASAVEGTPQGLAAYQNGVRINEVFGDTVNWELIPQSAIGSITLVSGNPLYGLNALGGALNIKMKDGFGFQGVESDTRGGSYGRIQESLQVGKQVGNFAAYAAIEGVREDGWRTFSPSEVARMYADLGVKDKNSEFHINFTGAQSALGAVGPTPVQMLEQNYNSVFTNPQTTDNRLAMLSLNGSTKLSDSWSVSGVTYLRSFHQSRVDGNVSSVAPCTGKNADGSPSGRLPQYLCLMTANGTEQYVLDQHGKMVTTAQYYGPNDTIGEIDRSSNTATSFGGSIQAAGKEKLFGLPNIFIVGASADHGEVKTTSIAELGTINTGNWTIPGNGIYLSGPTDIAPVNLSTTTSYYSFFFTDTLDLTRQLSLTAGGRFNYENISLADPTGLLTGDHVYTRFNPMAGLTYKFNEHLSAYGGYAEANRAPTPAELGCANPLQPCLLASFLVSDPELKQVVSKTWQAGLRGTFSPYGQGTLNWSAGVYRAKNFDDILNVTSPVIPTRGYFQNDGNTLRQGVEAMANYTLDKLTLNASYAYVDATFLSSLTLPFPANPYADSNGNVTVRPGDHLPSIPAHRFKLGADYSITNQWKVGADLVAASSQYFFADPGNQNPQLPGYGVVNLRTSYELAEGVTVYGMINNVFDHKYATYGTFYDTGITNVSGQPSTGLTNPEMITPAQPLSVYAGLRIKF